jgi:type IV secretory pathway TraG/TraD family ATPase VirD4
MRVRWQESDLKALAPLIKFVWQAIIGELTTAYDLAPDKSKCQRVLLDIEEAGRTGVPDLPEDISTLRSRHITVSAVFQDRSQGYALYGKDRAMSLFNNFRYQIYHRQDDLETAQHLEIRCGSTSGFAHSKTEYEESISRGESEQKIPLLTAQYIMYDMPDEEILGFWGKRPFLAKRFPKDPAGNTPAKALELPPLLPAIPDTELPDVEPMTSWHTDPNLYRTGMPQSVAAVSNEPS